MFVEIPAVNVNLSIYNFTRQFISNIFINSKYLSTSIYELNSKPASVIKKCNTCEISKKKYELKISYDVPEDISNIKTSDKNFLIKSFAPRLKVNKRVLESKNFGKEAYDYLNTNNRKFNEKSLKYLIKSFSNTKASIFSSNLL
jgi:hypothetical protein